jgi:hypothetical protein
MLHTNAVGRSVVDLLLVLASTVILDFEPRRETCPYFCTQTITCFEMGHPLRREEGSHYYWSLPIYWG